MSGRSIRIFLVDGTASGLRTAELGLSTIKALVVPRASLDAVAKRPEAQRTGIYVLIGQDAEQPGIARIYIGEGDSILARLTAHNKDPNKDFWEYAVFFVSKDENLTKAHVRYLEARLISLALQSKRCTLANGTAPTEQGRLPEADQVEMEEFITQARLLLGTLGYELFEPLPSPPVSTTTGENEDLPVFIYKGNGFDAECVVDSGSGHFVVRKGSRARKHETPNIVPGYRSLRKQLVETGILLDDGDAYVFTQDYPFTAITGAAQVVSSQRVSGRAVWRAQDGGKTFAEWQDEWLPKPEDT